MTDLTDGLGQDEDHHVQGDSGTSLHRRDDQPLGLSDVDNKVTCTYGQQHLQLKKVI